MYTSYYLYSYFIHSNALQLGCINVAHGAMKLTLSSKFPFTIVTLREFQQ